MAVRSIVDEEGRRVFNDDDLEGMLQKSAGALQEVARVALRINGISVEDVRNIVGN